MKQLAWFSTDNPLMGVDKLTFQTSTPMSTLLPRVTWGGGASAPVSSKHFGEAIPNIADIRNNPVMLNLFSRLGMLYRLQKKLNVLSRRNARIIPAKKAIACALRACEETDFQDVVFAGVEFLGDHHGEEDTVAGVIAHEYGHLLSDWNRGLNADDFSWEEIFEMRKEEEAAADAYAGKMLHLMGYKPEGMIRFLGKIQKKECHKYHSPATREAIIRTAFDQTRRRQNQMINLKSLFKEIASNPFTAKLIAVA